MPGRYANGMKYTRRKLSEDGAWRGADAGPDARGRGVEAVGDLEGEMSEDQVDTYQQHEHCWHVFQGATWVVLPDGYFVQKCCKCPTTRQIHRDHTMAGE